jgi:hypothetical protein
MSDFPDDDRDPLTDGWPDRDLILRTGRRIAREREDTMQLLADDGPPDASHSDRTGPRMVHGSRTTHQDTTASTDALASAFQKENRS